MSWEGCTGWAARKWRAGRRAVAWRTSADASGRVRERLHPHPRRRLAAHRGDAHRVWAALARVGGHHGPALLRRRRGVPVGRVEAANGAGDRRRPGGHPRGPPGPSRPREAVGLERLGGQAAPGRPRALVGLRAVGCPASRRQRSASRPPAHHQRTTSRGTGERRRLRRFRQPTASPPPAHRHRARFLVPQTHPPPTTRKTASRLRRSSPRSSDPRHRRRSTPTARRGTPQRCSGAPRSSQRAAGSPAAAPRARRRASARSS
jgi:hypothetical protein